MNETEIDEIIQQIPKVRDNRNYWFVRTQGGDYYESFVQRRFVAIGYNKVSLSEIKTANDSAATKDYLAEIIKSKYPDEQRPNYIGKQLIDFAYNIKKGDVVLVPSASSEVISIGEVVNTPVYEAEQSDECPFLKRKKVIWTKKHLCFDKLDPKLLKIKFSHRTITSIENVLHPFIERIISPLYVKNDIGHLTLHTAKKENVSAYSLFTTWSSLLDLVDSFGKNEGVAIDKENFDIRINVQSPGSLEFISASVFGLTALAFLIGAIIGVDFKNRIIGHFKTDGLIDKINTFLNERQNRKIKAELLEKLKNTELDGDQLVKMFEHPREKS